MYEHCRCGERGADGGHDHQVLGVVLGLIDLDEDGPVGLVLQVSADANADAAVDDAVLPGPAAQVGASMVDGGTP